MFDCGKWLTPQLLCLLLEKEGSACLLNDSGLLRNTRADSMATSGRTKIHLMIR